LEVGFSPSAIFQDGHHFPRWLPFSKMAAIFQDGCHFPRWRPTLWMVLCHGHSFIHLSPWPDYLLVGYHLSPFPFCLHNS
jgi:hypothetical protein